MSHLLSVASGKFPLGVCARTCMRAKSVQSCPTLCNPMDCSLPGFSVHGILQARILEMPSSRGSSPPRIEPMSLRSPALAGGFFTAEPPREPNAVVLTVEKYPCVNGPAQFKPELFKG